MYERFKDDRPEVVEIVKAAYDKFQAEHDTITLGEVVKLLVKMETDIAALTDKEWPCPVWDEYLSAMQQFDRKTGRTVPYSYLFERFVDRLGTNYRWLGCYVVVGGSEGMYLHVDAIKDDGTPDRLIIGKSLGVDGYDPRLWLSAMRIQYVLTLGS